MPPEYDSVQEALFPESYNGLPRYAQDEFNPNVSTQSMHSSASFTNLSQTTPKAAKGPDMLDGLRALPEVRQIPWKTGMELSLEKSTEHPRSQTRGAFLLVTRGKVRDPPCSRCVNGVGRFTVCVSLEGWFKGACATCEMATRGHLCSIRKEIEEIKKPYVDNVENPPSLEALESPVSEHNEPENPLKRRRTSTTALPSPAAQAFVMPYPQNESRSQGNGYSYSHNTNTTPAAASASIPAQNLMRPPLLDYVYQKQYPPNGTKRHHLLHRAQRDSQEPATQAIGSNGYGGVITGAGFASTSLSPSTQLNQGPPPQPSWQEQKSSKVPPGLRDRDAALIDTLPRKKQKQIFSIIGGIQSGIRSVRQQTEDLQKQLDLLQEAFGIGVDEDEDSVVV